MCLYRTTVRTAFNLGVIQLVAFSFYLFCGFVAMRIGIILVEKLSVVHLPENSIITDGFVNFGIKLT